MKVEPERMAEAAMAASELLKSLGNPHRLMILCQLIDGERPVGELATTLRQIVDRHLLLGPKPIAQRLVQLMCLAPTQP
jgi:DNA-binding transcriptional ArsR family regulator